MQIEDCLVCIVIVEALCLMMTSTAETCPLLKCITGQRACIFTSSLSLKANSLHFMPTHAEYRLRIHIWFAYPYAYSVGLSIRCPIPHRLLKDYQRCSHVHICRFYLSYRKPRNLEQLFHSFHNISRIINPNK